MSWLKKTNKTGPISLNLTYDPPIPANMEEAVPAALLIRAILSHIDSPLYANGKEQRYAREEDPYTAGYKNYTFTTTRNGGLKVDINISGDYYKSEFSEGKGIFQGRYSNAERQLTPSSQQSVVSIFEDHFDKKPEADFSTPDKVTLTFSKSAVSKIAEFAKTEAPTYPSSDFSAFMNHPVTVDSHVYDRHVDPNKSSHPKPRSAAQLAFF